MINKSNAFNQIAKESQYLGLAWIRIEAGWKVVTGSALFRTSKILCTNKEALCSNKVNPFAIFPAVEGCEIRLEMLPDKGMGLMLGGRM